MKDIKHIYISSNMIIIDIIVHCHLLCDFFSLIDQYMKGVLKGPFNIDARGKAGFSVSELNTMRGVAE